MIHSHPLVTPLPRLMQPLRAIGRQVFERGFRGWRHGCVAIALPDGTEMIVGGVDAPAHEHQRLEILDDRFFVRAMTRGELGVGESYVAGEWRAPDLTGLIRLFVRNLAYLELETPVARLGRLRERIRHRLRFRRAASERNIHAHYDLGNQFYSLFLDRSMMYSCAVYETGGETLEEAQACKLDRLCDALELAADDHLLEIGCGWGGMAMHAARTRGCRVTAITISREQLAWARQRVAEAGLADRIDIRYCDYRDLHGQWDKLVSIEMLEAVGRDHLPGFFQACDRLLAPGGRAAIQTITMPDERWEAYVRDVDWMQTYIFPGALIPSMGAIDRALARTTLRRQRTDEIGPHYATTLRAWRARWRERIDDARALGLDLPFERTWQLYLAFSEASFAERTLGDAQFVLTR